MFPWYRWSAVNCESQLTPTVQSFRTENMLRLNNFSSTQTPLICHLPGQYALSNLYFSGPLFHFEEAHTQRADGNTANSTFQPSWSGLRERNIGLEPQSRILHLTLFRNGNLIETGRVTIRPMQQITINCSEHSRHGSEKREKRGRSVKAGSASIAETPLLVIVVYAKRKPFS